MSYNEEAAQLAYDLTLTDDRFNRNTDEMPEEWLFIVEVATGKRYIDMESRRVVKYLPSWEMFIEDNDKTFRREYGVKNDEGDRDVLGWMTYEGMEHQGRSEVGIREMNKWELRATMSCAEAAIARNRRDG